MYINYFQDRKKLGYKSIKDIDTIKKLSHLKNIIASPGIWIIKKGEQTIILIVSKKVLVAILAGSLIFGNFKSDSGKVPNFQYVTEGKVVSNKKLTSFENSHNSGRIIQTENNGILAVQRKINNRAEFEEITLVDFKKTGPGARAKADALRNAKGSGSSIFRGATGFSPQNVYCHYHHQEPLSCRPRAKLSKNLFQPKDDGNNPANENGQGKFDPKDYQGGPQPFKEFKYDNPKHTRENVDFSNESRMSHSYDGHAKDCFNIMENRNKLNLQKFQEKLENYIQSPETKRIDGSWRYETPAYHYINKNYINKNETLIVTVNATNNEYISVRNATAFQLNKLNIDGNLGFDARPSMSLTLRLRGPNNSSSLNY